MIDLIERDFVRKYKFEILLAGILLLSAFLNLWNIWSQGFTNTFYAAAVKSTLVNPAAGFFNSFDPAGFVTVDKPPVGLWVQAAFAAVLGFKGWVLILPQALAGIGSVALVYFIVARPFGKPAGLVAALALAVTPILIAVSRNGTMDTQLIFVLLLAVWAVLKATRERSLPWLLVSVILVGIGFNIKMIQAFVVVPAILLVYLLGTTNFSWKKRALHLGIAVMVLLCVSLSWAVAVDMVPASERPYIGGSGDNTVLGLIINYNGLERLGLENRGMDFMGNGAVGAQRNGTLREAGQLPAAGMRGADAGQYRDVAATRSGAAPGGMANGEGAPGLTRFFGEALAGQFSWLLPLALIGLLAWVRRPATLTLKGFEKSGLFSERGLVLIAMLFWLVPGLLFFSYSTAFGHTYYIATIAPPLAAIVGIGAIAMYREYLVRDLGRLDPCRGGAHHRAPPGPFFVIRQPVVRADCPGCSLRDPPMHRGSYVPETSGYGRFTRPQEIHGGHRARPSLCRALCLGLYALPVQGHSGCSGPPQAGRIGGGTGATGFLTGTDRAGFAQNAAGRERLYGVGNTNALASSGNICPGRHGQRNRKHPAGKLPARQHHQ